MSSNGILKPINNEISVTTANTVYNSQLVRIYAPSAAFITITDSSSVITGTFTMPSNSVEYVEKDRISTITANTSVFCVPISYKS